MITQEQLQSNYDGLKRLHESANIAIERLEEANSSLTERNEFMNKTNLNLENALNINKKIMTDTVIAQNTMREDFANEIAIYKDEINKLKSGE